MGFFTTFVCMYEGESGTDIVIRSMGLGIFTQTFLKCFLIIIGADSYQELIAQIEMLYRSKDKKTQEVMIKKIHLCEQIYNIISVVNSSAVLIFIAYPWLSIFLMDEPTLMFPFYIPFLDPHHYLGFTATSLFHSVLIIYTLLFHNAFDIAFINFTVHAIAIVDLIKIDYDELTEFAENSRADNEHDMMIIRQKLKGIVQAQKEFDSYIDKLNNVYEWPCFVTSSTSIYSICIALILIMIIKLPVAYGLCWALFGQLFCSYMNGEVINHQYARLSRYLYELPWHKFRLAEQKMLVLMIQKAARPNLMNILFTGLLNLETFSTICNAIYSYYNICETLIKK
ncbi:odorant receptor 30a-like [Chironomus tepperi]|uniref:odorant receptor 30a-like n=1 Tax=Chironomus tepperi TaxID=113505 RepID=UPI00391FA297